MSSNTTGQVHIVARTQESTSSRKGNFYLVYLALANLFPSSPIQKPVTTPSFLIKVGLMKPKIYLDITPWQRGPTTGVGTAIHETLQALRHHRPTERPFELRLVSRDLPSPQALSLGATKQNRINQVIGERNSIFHGFELKLPPALFSKKVVTLFDVWSLEPNPYQDPKFQKVKSKALIRTIHRADAIVVTCEAVKEKLLKSIPRIRAPIFNIPLGPSFPAETAKPESPKVKPYLLGKRPFLLSVATFEKRKNQCLWLRALKNWPDCPFDLVTVGKKGFGGEEALSLLKELRSEGLGGIDLELASPSDLRSLYFHCSGVILTSFDEGFGFPALDALSFEKPLLISDIFPLREIAEEAAIYVSPLETDLNVVRSKLSQLIEKPNPSWVALAKSRAARFSWEGSANAHVRIYQSLLGES